MVNVMCPADALTPGGVDCGLAAYIDRQLAGGFGKGARLYMRGPLARE
jgi:gluconate 2-dehydrogenase gamma chain